MGIGSSSSSKRSSHQHVKGKPKGDCTSQTNSSTEYWKTNQNDKCVVCGQMLNPRTSGYNPVGAENESIFCCGCQRYKPKLSRSYFNLSDGRYLCPQCFPTAVLDTKQLKAVIYKMQKFYKQLNRKFDINFPILPVDKHQLKPKNLTAGRRVRLFGDKKGEGKIYRQNAKSGVKFYSPITKERCIMKGINNIYVVTSKLKLSDGEVAGIMLTHGRPEVLTAASLSHEMMHAWLGIQGCMNLERKLEEGICEVMVCKWSEYWLELMPELDQFQLKLIEERKNNILAPSRPYGEGFKEARQVVDKYSLKAVMNELVRTGKFL